MGQQEVSDFLKKHKAKWHTTKEIAESLNVSIGSATSNLAKLRKSKQVLFKPAGKGNKYVYKHGTKLLF